MVKVKVKVKVKVLTRDGDVDPSILSTWFPLFDIGKFEMIHSPKNPDFLVYPPSGKSVFLDYPCVRISNDAERYTPDFNLCDYAISDDIMEFGDRHCRMPGLANFSEREGIDQLRKKRSEFKQENLNAKDMFCNFIYTNDIGDSMRKILFDRVSMYKRVSSGGRLFNNIGYQIAGGPGDYTEKIRFQERCKFTLAIENVNYPGHTTEKLLHPFLARSIPIYWGNPKVAEFFNPEAFINCNEFTNLDALVKHIQEIDENNDLYLKMINTPPLNPKFIPEEFDANVARFLEHIFCQPVEQAYRRARVMYSALHEADFKKGRRIRERRRAFEYKAVRTLDCIGIRRSRFYRWYKERFYYR